MGWPPQLLVSSIALETRQAWKALWGSLGLFFEATLFVVDVFSLFLREGSS
jgi:hypothetical protein